jgi:hypothetical protein
VSMDQAMMEAKDAYTEFQINLNDFLKKEIVQQVIGDWDPTSEDNKTNKWLVPLFAVNFMQDIRDPSLRMLYDCLCDSLKTWRHWNGGIQGININEIIHLCRRIAWLTATSVNVSRWVHMRAKVKQHHAELNQSQEMAVNEIRSTHT